MADDPNGYLNGGRRDYQRILIAALSAAWAVVVLAGAGWIGSIQSQTNANALNHATLAVALAKLEVKVDILSQANAEMRVKLDEIERAPVGRRGL